MERSLLDMIMARSKLSTLMEATSNLSMLLTVMVNLGVSRLSKRKELSLLAVMITSSTSSASRIRLWSEKAKFGPMTCMAESHMRQIRSNQLPLLSAQLQLINKVEESLTVLSGNT